MKMAAIKNFMFYKLLSKGLFHKRAKIHSSIENSGVFNFFLNKPLICVN
jgi:hypothetical protein